MRNKTRNRILLVTMLAVLVAPSLTYAAWWNPSTWFKKPASPAKAVQVQTSTTTPVVPVVKEKMVVKPVAAHPSTTKEVKKEVSKPVVAQPTKSTDQSSEIEKLKKEVEELKKTQLEEQKKREEQGRIDAAVKAALDKQAASNGQQVVQPQQSAVVPAPQTSTVPTEEDYSFEAKYKIKTLIDIYKSHEKWLEDTSNQFKSASFALAGYPRDSLYGSVRNLANASIDLIRALKTNPREWISFLESLEISIEEFRNKNQSSLINKARFDLLNLKLPDQKSLEKDLAKIREDINLSLDSVMESLPRH